MEKVRIQDDLFHHVNDEWIENAVIPEDLPSTGGFVNLAKDVEKLMIDEFIQMDKSKEYPNDYLKRCVTIFNKLRNVEERNALGFAPAMPALNKIKAIKDVKALNKELSEFIYSGYPLPFSISVDANMKDTIHHSLSIQGPSTLLPDTSYYREENKAQKEMMIGLWSQMATMVMKYTDLSEEEQEEYIQDTLMFDELIAKYVKSSEEWSEYVKCYNPMKTSKVCSLVKPIKFEKLLEEIFGKVPEEIIVLEPRYLKAFKQVFNPDNFTLYIHWAYVVRAINSCSLLSEDLRNIGTMFRRALTGVQAIPSPEKFAYQVSSDIYSEPVGLYYGDKYFGQAAKADVTEMVMQIIEMYKERIKVNDFLEEATKEKAITKLSMMKVHMGYPDKVDELYDLAVYDESKCVFDIIGDLGKIRRKYEFSKLYKDVNRDQWVMPGHMVNACYNPFTNDITFPAAILQAPFYSIKQTRSENLGGIGAVIGHEISHAFDNNGAKCDEYGNINNWWTKQDEKMFEKKTKLMIKQFDGIELPWGKVNGKFIVSENIADNGGMAVTLAIMNKMEEKNYEEYFINWAKVWCQKAKPEYLQLLLTVDVHGPAILRTNMPPRNFPEWYDTFKVKKTDQMYISPKKRIVIW